MLVQTWSFLALCTALGSSYSVTERNEFVTALLRHFHVGRCILLLNLRDVEISDRMKHLAQRNIFTVAMDETDLADHLFGSSFPPHKEAVVGVLDTFEWSTVMSEAYHPAKLAKLLWIIFFSGDLATLHNLKIPYNCEFILVHQEKGGYGLLELYHVKNTTFFKRYGVWNRGSGLDVSRKHFYQRRYNLHGISLTMLRDVKGECENDYECSHLDLWHSMGKMMNYTTREITYAEINEGGEDLDVSSQVTAFHASALSIDPYLLFSMAPIWKISMYMYVQQEDDVTSVWSAFLRPFSPLVWAAIAFVLSMASVCFVLISRQSSQTNLVHARAQASVESAFAPLDSICNQCGSYIGRRLSRRILVITMRALAVLAVPSYSGVIISTLTLKYPILPFSDLESFADEGSFKLGAVNSSFGVGYFEYSENEFIKRIATTLFESQATMPTSYAQGLRKCCKERFAFLAPQEILLEEKDTHCQLLQIKTPVYSTYAGMHLAPYSQFRAIFFHNLVKFQMTGILTKLTTKRKLVEIESQEHNDVIFFEIAPLLTLLAVGITMSLAFLLVERCSPPPDSKEMSKWQQSGKMLVYDGLCYNTSKLRQTKCYCKE